MACATSAVDGVDHSSAQFIQGPRRKLECLLGPHLVGRDNLVVERLHLLHETRLIKCAAICHDRHGLRHLQRRDLRVPLPDRQVCDVSVEQTPAVRRLHVLIIRHASFRLAAQRDAAFRSKAQLDRPIDDRFCASLDSHLIKPRVTRFRQRLNKIQRAAIAFLPIVKSEIADFDCGHALVTVFRPNRTGFESGDADRDFEGRSRWVRRTECPWEKLNVGIVL